MDLHAGVAALDCAFDGVAAGAVFEALEDLAAGLTRLRSEADSAGWRNFCREVVPAHRLWPIIHQAPFTHRAFEKPRGYPGDAVVLDWIYGYERLPADTVPSLRAIHSWEWQTPSCVSVRNRKAVLASTIDEVAALSERPVRVLAVACGHLREASGSAAVQSGGVQTFFAMDQDPESLAIARTMAPNIQTVHGSVRGILSNKVRFADLDLVYAAGLYDYLGPSLAQELTRKLFDMLRPGGTLLIANFNPTLRDIGYLEAYMDWQLLYRTDQEVIDCFGSIAAAELANVRCFREAAGNITFAEGIRAV